MAFTDINAASKGSNTGTIIDYSVASKSTDAAGAQKETEWINTKAGQYLGYYKTIPELKMAIDAKATWTIGKGFEADELTQMFLSTIKGFGKDTFNAILENLIRNYHIYGDAYAEIIREGDQIINLKVLDPSTMKHIANQEGIIIRFEQVSKGSGKTIKFQPEDIFHLSRNRIADEIHGVSIIEAVETIILMRNEAMADYKKLLHRNVYPVRIWHLDTDLPAKVATFKAKVAESKGEGEDIFVPKGAVQTELSGVSQNSSLNPLPWIQLLNQYFFQTVGVPQIILGGSQELTQTAAQIAYLSFEQTIEEEQLFIEEQVLSQLNVEIQLTFPASLRNNLLSDEREQQTLDQQLNQTSDFVPTSPQLTGRIGRGNQI